MSWYLIHCEKTECGFASEMNIISSLWSFSSLDYLLARKYVDLQVGTAMWVVRVGTLIFKVEQRGTICCHSISRGGKALVSSAGANHIILWLIQCEEMFDVWEINMHFRLQEITVCLKTKLWHGSSSKTDGHNQLEQISHLLFKFVPSYIPPCLSHCSKQSTFSSLYLLCCFCCRPLLKNPPVIVQGAQREEKTNKQTKNVGN